MAQHSSTSSRSRSHASRSDSWLQKKIRRIRNSRVAQKRLKNTVIVCIAVLIAFILGFYFFGPSFSAD
jgi:hypothetical protein